MPPASSSSPSWHPGHGFQMRVCGSYPPSTRCEYSAFWYLNDVHLLEMKTCNRTSHAAFGELQLGEMLPYIVLSMESPGHTISQGVDLATYHPVMLVKVRRTPPLVPSLPRHFFSTKVLLATENEVLTTLELCNRPFSLLGHQNSYPKHSACKSSTS